MAERQKLVEWIKHFPIFQFAVVILLALLLLQILAYLLGLVYTPAATIKLGWVVLILAAAIAVWFSLQIVQTRIIGGGTGQPITRGEVFIILLLIGGTVAALIYFPKIVPQIFDASVKQIQSFVGIP